MAVKIDIQPYNQHFAPRMQQIKAGPIENRQCNDVCCIGVFTVIFALLIGGAGFFIFSSVDTIRNLGQGPVLTGIPQLGRIIARSAGIVVGMLILSIILAILFVFLSKSFPACMVYSMIVITYIILIALVILGFVVSNYILVVFAIIIGLINAVILWCYWDYIKIGIVLLKISGDFITAKPSIYFVALLSLAINVLFQIIYVFGWLGIYTRIQEEAIETRQNSSSTTWDIISYIWYALGIFFGFFFYYCMVFVVAVAAAYWYYRQQKNALHGFSYLPKNFGSITFASVVITIITMARIIASQQGGGQGIFGLVQACIACILACIEEIVKVLNHNAVIVMAVTGQGYIDSAKSTVSLIFDNFGLFVIVNFISNFITAYGTIICVVPPAAIGGALIYYTVEKETLPVVLGAIFIFLLAWIVSSIIIGILDETLSCMFIFYCFDSKFKQNGINVSNIPNEIKDLFDGAKQNREYRENLGTEEIAKPKHQQSHQNQQNYNQGYQNQSYQNQGYQNQGYQNQGYQNQGYQNQGYQNQGYQNQGYQNQGYQNQGYQNQGFN